MMEGDRDSFDLRAILENMVITTAQGRYDAKLSDDEYIMRDAGNSVIATGVDSLIYQRTPDIEAYSAYENHDQIGMDKAGLDIAMGAIGEFGNLPGFIVSTDYTLTKFYINWVNSINQAYENETGQRAWSRIMLDPH